MKKWLKFWVLTCLLIYGECQEPEDTTRKYADELFKSKTTKTTNIDINTTLRPTEIENNSTATESTGSNDVGAARNDLDENDELSSARDSYTSKEETKTSIFYAETTMSSDWNTRTEDDAYPISFKDVFEKSIDVVKDEMKGIGIIQNWLKEQANDLIGETTTPAEDYDYSQTTYDYSDGMTYDDDQTDVPDEENEQKESQAVEDKVEQQTESKVDTKEESVTEAVKFVEYGDTLERIENDLDKLQRVETMEEEGVKEQKELVKDIEENLNKLEELVSQETTTADIGIVRIEEVEETTTIGQNTETVDTPIGEELVTMTENVETTESLSEEQTTKVSIEEEEIVPDAQVAVFEPTEKSEITTIILPLITEDVENATVTEIEHVDETTIHIEITNELNSQETTILPSDEESTAYNVTIKIVAETTTVQDTTKEVTTSRTTVQSDTTTLNEVIITESDRETTSETLVTTESPIITTKLIFSITENLTTEAAIVETTNAPSIATDVSQQTTQQETKEEVIIVTETSTDEERKEEERKLSIMPLDKIENTNGNVSTLNEAITESDIETSSETLVTTESPIITTKLIFPITENPTTEAAIIETTNVPSIVTEVPQQTTEQQNNERVTNTDEESQEEKEYDTETVELSTLALDNTYKLEETEQILATTTTTANLLEVLQAETRNITETIDAILNKNEEEFKVMTSNSLDVFSIDDNFNPIDDSDIDEEDKTEELDISLEVSANNPSQDIENDEITTSEEDLDDLQKILIDVNHTEEDSTLDEVDQTSKTESKEEVDAEIVEPKLSALITDEMNGNICLNASGLSIKIATKNNTFWVPAHTKVFGECTSFGAYLNLTWRAGIRVNNTLSFTFIGDDEESYIEEVILKTNKETFIATQLERYFNNPTIINLSNETTITLSSMNLQLHRKKEDDYATISLLTVDNALALQIASGGLCLFIILIAVAIYSYRKLRSQARIFKVSLEK